MPAIQNYRGIIPAISCPFTPDHRIDEPALRKLASEHPCEVVGKEVRSMYSWSDEDKLVNN